jgi:hypothetical protein
VIGGNDAGLCAHGSLDVMGKLQGERNDRQRRAGGARGRENGTVGNVKILDTVDAAVRIHHASFGIHGHAGGPM